MIERIDLARFTLFRVDGKGTRGKEQGRKAKMISSLQVQTARAIILLIKLNAANTKDRLINDVFA